MPGDAAPRVARGDEVKARVFVTLKPSVFDPQGRTIAEALHSLGYTGIGEVRQGKYFELDIDAPSAEQAHTLAAEMADRVLANPVIESYRIELEGAPGPGAGREQEARV
jgi:phosphoribosylformylglycinamidine synthase subunit PurS